MDPHRRAYGGLVFNPAFDRIARCQLARQHPIQFVATAGITQRHRKNPKQYRLFLFPFIIEQEYSPPYIPAACFASLGRRVRRSAGRPLRPPPPAQGKRSGTSTLNWNREDHAEPEVAARRRRAFGAAAGHAAVGGVEAPTAAAAAAES